MMVSGLKGNYFMVVCYKCRKPMLKQESKDNLKRYHCDECNLDLQIKEGEATDVWTWNEPSSEKVASTPD